MTWLKNPEAKSSLINNHLYLRTTNRLIPRGGFLLPALQPQLAISEIAPCNEGCFLGIDRLNFNKLNLFAWRLGENHLAD